ncbi:MAG: hypothetical protein QNK37_02535 [Acidobacteriota bacterium]|nr:hypothetical protein [Acidobacteriota bacterium]
MRRILLLLPLLCCTGCMDLNMQLSVDAKGGGNLEFRMELLDQMFQLVRSRAPKDGIDFNQLEKDALKGVIEENGGKLRRYSNEVVSGVRVIDIAARFPDAEKVFDKLGGRIMRLESTPDGVWTWRVGDTEYGAAFNDLSSELLEQQLAGFQSVMQGMKVKLGMEVPQLVDTNLTRLDTKRVSYDLDFDRDIGKNQGRAATDPFRTLLAPKYVSFKGITRPESKTVDNDE